MNTLLSKLAGYKTYGTALVGIFYLLGAKFGWWKLDPAVLATFGFGGVAFLRAGVKNEIGSVLSALMPGLDTGAQPAPGGGPGAAGKQVAGLFVVCCSLAAAGLMMGCAGTNRTLYNTENLAVDGARAAGHTFNSYYQTATNGASPAQLAQLNKERDQVYATIRKFGTVVATVDGLRLAYATNSANTNLTALQIALETLSSQSDSIQSTVQLLMGATPVFNALPPTGGTNGP